LPPAGGKAPVWQVAHCATTVTWLWLKLLGFQPEVAWQLAQLVAPTGTWLVALPVAALPLWQLAQLVAEVKVLWSTLPADQLLVDLWQVSHTVWPAWMAVLGLAAAWQVAHCVLTLTLLCSLAGVQAAKPALWQLSQLALAKADTSW
jgi:hypothetical protein